MIVSSAVVSSEMKFFVIPSFVFLFSKFPNDKGNFYSDFPMVKSELFPSRPWSAVSREMHTHWSMLAEQEPQIHDQKTTLSCSILLKVHF